MKSCSQQCDSKAGKHSTSDVTSRVTLSRDHKMATTSAFTRRAILGNKLPIWKQIGGVRAIFGSSVNMSSAPVGFIGLGNMGGHMAKNLINKGYKLIVYDLSKSAVAALKDAGATDVQHPSDVADKARTIITMLPSSPHVMQVYAGKDGILKSVQPGTLLIDSSTIDPQTSKDVSSLVTEKKATFVDAPVSGGVNAAKAATLTFMVGGPKTGFDTAKTFLDCMGKNVVHCGDVGTGQAAKICNNMLLAICMIGTAETMNLGMRLGLDSKLLAKILNMSSGRSWSSEVYNPVPGVMEGVPSSNEYRGGFGTPLMTKDLGLAQNAATSSKSPTPMGSLAHQIYQMMTQGGYAEKDFSAVFEYLREKNIK